MALFSLGTSFGQLLLKALKALDLQAVKFGTHSFQIRATLTAAAMGYMVAKIQEIGWWKSGAFRRYVRPLQFVPFLVSCSFNVD